MEIYEDVDVVLGQKGVEIVRHVVSPGKYHRTWEVMVSPELQDLASGTNLQVQVPDSSTSFRFEDFWVTF